MADSNKTRESPPAESFGRLLFDYWETTRASTTGRKQSGGVNRALIPGMIYNPTSDYLKNPSEVKQKIVKREAAL